MYPKFSKLRLRVAARILGITVDHGRSLTLAGMAKG